MAQSSTGTPHFTQHGIEWYPPGACSNTPPHLLLARETALSPTIWSHKICVAGVQGYKKVGISAGLNTGQSILEICGSIVVLVLVKESALKRLTSLGLVSLAAAALSAIVGVSLIPIIAEQRAAAEQSSCMLLPGLLGLMYSVPLLVISLAPKVRVRYLRLLLPGRRHSSPDDVTKGAWEA